MNINDMNTNYDFDSVKKILESRFNWTGRWDSMTEDEVRSLGQKADAKLAEAGDISSPKYNLYLFIREAAKMRLEQIKNQPVVEAVGSEMVDQAEVVLAAQEIGDKLQAMAEDIAQMQVQDMMPLVQAMKEQMGMDQASAFESSATGALQGLLDTMKATKESYDNAVLVLQGEAPANDMGMDDGGFGDMPDTGIDTDGDGEMEPTDDFGGADAMAGDDADAGREMKESMDDQIKSALKAVQETSKDGKISKAQLEAIKQQVSEKHKRRLPGVDPATGPMVPPLDPDELPQRVRTPEPAPDSPVSMDMMSPELQKRFKNKKMAPPVPIRHRQKIGMDR